MNTTLAIGTGLLALACAGLAIARKRGPQPDVHRATVEGRTYFVYRLGGGIYQVERKQGDAETDATIATLMMSVSEPPQLLKEWGVPWAVDLAKKDIYKFPADLFDAPTPAPSDSPVNYTPESQL